MLNAMRTVPIEFPGGAMRTMDQIDTGLGWVLVAVGVGLALLGFCFASRSHPASAARPVIFVLALITAVLLLISLVYFFIIPITFFGLAFLFALVSLVRDTRAGVQP